MSKGSQVAISGRIQTRSYDAKDGTKRYVTEVVADQFGGVEFLGSKGSNSSGNSFGNSNEYSAPANDAFSGGFEEDITPVDDGDMPF
jgi:single-strand DNA-binding protein